VRLSQLNCELPTGVARPVFGWRGCFVTRWGQIDAVRWSMVALCVGLVIWGLTDVRRRGRVDPQHPEVHKTDFTVYTIAGQTMLYGGDPYAVSNSRGWKYLYPPLFALLVAPLDRLDPQAQVVSWFAISVLLAWGCYRECVRIAVIVLPGEAKCGPFGPIPTWIGAAAVAAATLPVLNCLQRGQMGVTVMYFLLLGFRLLIEGRSAVGSFGAGAVLAIPVVLKVTPLLPVAFVLGQQVLAAWRMPQRSTELLRRLCGIGGCIAGLAALFLLLPALIVGWQTNLGHLHTWWNTVAMHEESSRADDFAGDSSSERNQSLTNAVHRFGNWIGGHPQPGADDAPTPVGDSLPMDVPLVSVLLLAVRGAIGFLLLAIAQRNARTHDLLGQTVGFCVANVSTLIICQVARGHYFVIWLPTIMFASSYLIRQQRPRAAAWLAIVPVVLVVTHYAFLDWAGRVGILGLGTAGWYVSICLLLLQMPTTAAVTNTVSAASPHVRRAA
jgi:Glycosyltransferase family 87